MKQFLSATLPSMFAASLLSLACGGPLEEAPDAAETQAFQAEGQALTTLSVGISSTIGKPNQVTLTVTDSLGATASAQRNFQCTTIAP
ncbi:hypothetical protein JYK02_32130 [Corallococcus macrosporus]|uniref:Uncharacterized protein n=1 Tax=Corallococcus macrosporus TaxID=35 RepID=A0ABS3DLK6_9BACT|nr:hypothetical protein [Corallococcus macrosporus]MBN8232175.1 hypothetical protein [Corallococcus macrosporus]